MALETTLGSSGTDSSSRNKHGERRCASKWSVAATNSRFLTILSHPLRKKSCSCLVVVNKHLLLLDAFSRVMAEFSDHSLHLSHSLLSEKSLLSRSQTTTRRCLIPICANICTFHPSPSHYIASLPFPRRLPQSSAGIVSTQALSSN